MSAETDRRIPLLLALLVLVALLLMGLRFCFIGLPSEPNDDVSAPADD
ncbi:MAG: hypothetical protein ACOCYV_02260 [Planctomycetota bacterium]